MELYWEGFQDVLTVLEEDPSLTTKLELITAQAIEMTQTSTTVIQPLNCMKSKETSGNDFI